MQGDGYEQVIFCQDQTVGLSAIIVLHDTTLGPALGGVRMWPYNTEDEALHDVMGLARGMTYKNALAGLELGGAKAVIIGDAKCKSKELLKSFARFVDRLQGRYVTAVDVGINSDDIEVIREETKYVVGVREGTGNPSPLTAYGVYQGMLAGVEQVLGSTSLQGLRVAVQGMGHVAESLSELLVRDGAEVTVTDLDAEKLKLAKEKFNATIVEPDAIYSQPCDIFAPCALGGVINSTTVDLLRCKLVAGAANTQLAEKKYAEVLVKKGIVALPDYVINAGGAIAVALERCGTYCQEHAKQKVAGIYNTTNQILRQALEEKISPYLVADRMVETMIANKKAEKLPASF
jgi:leucine dehydrogenase